MEGLWQMLFLVSRYDLESLTEELNFMFQKMQFIQFFYCDIWRVLCIPVLEWEQQGKKHDLANNVQDPILFPYSYMFLWCGTGMLQPSMTPVTKCKWLVFSQFLSECKILLSCFPHWGNDGLTHTILRSGIWCLDSYPNTVYSVECDIMNITSPNCLSWLLPEELR